jgi:hypothetical protein
MSFAALRCSANGAPLRNRKTKYRVWIANGLGLQGYASSIVVRNSFDENLWVPALSSVRLGCKKQINCPSADSIQTYLIAQ